MLELINNIGLVFLAFSALPLVFYLLVASFYGVKRLTGKLR